MMAMQAASAGVQAAGSIMGGYQKAAGLKANAGIADANADLSNASAARDAESLLRHGRMQVGAQSAAAAQNGLGFTGSVTDSLKDAAANVQMDATNSLYGGQVKAVGFHNQASSLRSEAGNAVTAGWIGAASSLLGAAGDYMKGMPQKSALGAAVNAGNAARAGMARPTFLSFPGG